MPALGQKIPLIQRLGINSRIEENGCVVWTGMVNHEGYGRIQIDRYPRMVHRVSYELFIGPIEDGLVIDHLCGNRRYFAVNHLEAVTQRENVLRTWRGTGREPWNKGKKFA